MAKPLTPKQRLEHFLIGEKIEFYDELNVFLPDLINWLSDEIDEFLQENPDIVDAEVARAKYGVKKTSQQKREWLGRCLTEEILSAVVINPTLKKAKSK